MTLLILEMLLALGVIIGIMVWTLKTRTDTPLDANRNPADPVSFDAQSDAGGADATGSGQAGDSKPPSDPHA